MATPSLNTPYLVLAGTVVVAIGISFLVIMPQIEAMRNTRQDNVRLEQELQEKRTFLQSIDRRTAELQANELHEREMAVALPTDQSFDDVVRILDRGAQATGVVINNVQNNSEASSRNFEALAARNKELGLPEHVIPLAASINFIGSYQQARQFIDYLEKNIRLMDPTRLTMDKGETPDLINVSMEIQFYQYN